MTYLNRAIEIAKDRGYFDYSEVVSLIHRIPDWLRRLETEAGINEFELRRDVKVPEALREFYANQQLVCFLQATLDSEVFLETYQQYPVDDLPSVVEWQDQHHLVFGFHGHSGMVATVRIGTPDPIIVVGFEDDESSADADERVFSQYVQSWVEGYEATLNSYVQRYKSFALDRDRKNQMCSVAWIRNMPGIGNRINEIDQIVLRRDGTLDRDTQCGDIVRIMVGYYAGEAATVVEIEEAARRASVVLRGSGQPIDRMWIPLDDLQITLMNSE